MMEKKEEIEEYDFVICGSGVAGSYLAKLLTDDFSTKVLLCEWGGNSEQTIIDPESPRNNSFLHSSEGHVLRFPKMKGGGLQYQQDKYITSKRQWDLLQSIVKDDDFSHASLSSFIEQVKKVMDRSTNHLLDELNNKDRKLTIVSGCYVEKVLFKNDHDHVNPLWGKALPKAYGVKTWTKSGSQKCYFVKRKVILCCGIFSSVVLQTSGIGDSKLLQECEIPVVFSNSHVGKHLSCPLKIIDESDDRQHPTEGCISIISNSPIDLPLVKLGLKLQDGCILSHFVGTNRIHKNPSLGVVDNTFHVHGVEDLCICDSSIIPCLISTSMIHSILVLTHRFYSLLINEYNKPNGITDVTPHKPIILQQCVDPTEIDDEDDSDKEKEDEIRIQKQQSQVENEEDDDLNDISDSTYLSGPEEESDLLDDDDVEVEVFPLVLSSVSGNKPMDEKQIKEFYDGSIPPCNCEDCVKEDSVIENKRNNQPVPKKKLKKNILKRMALYKGIGDNNSCLSRYGYASEKEEEILKNKKQLSINDSWYENSVRVVKKFQRESENKN